MGDLAEIKEKVQRYLTANFNGIMVDRDGDLSFRADSARIFVRVREWVKDQVAVNVWSPFLLDVPLTQELKDYVAIEGASQGFGAIHLEVIGDKAAMIYSYGLLGDFLDEAELVNACLMVGSIAENLDDELKSRFGGRRFHET